MLGELYVAFLGTSAGDGPTASRGAPCMLVHLGSEIWMVDCGDGSYRQLQQFRALHAHRALLPGSLSAQVDFSSRIPITRIFITHLHAGHVAGLPLMLMRLLSDAVAAEVSKQLDRERQRSASGGASTESPPVRFYFWLYGQSHAIVETDCSTRATYHTRRTGRIATLPAKRAQRPACESSRCARALCCT